MIYICIPHTPDRRDRLQKTVDSIRENTKIPHCIVTYENNYIGWANAIHEMIQDIDGLIWIVGSDVIVKEGCVEELYRRYRETFKDTGGIVEPFNELHGSKLAQHPFGDAHLLRKYIHKGYKHCFADNELTERAYAEGKMDYAPNAIIDHQHAVNNKAPMDAGYEFSLNPKNYEIDLTLYKQRKENGYKD